MRSFASDNNSGVHPLVMEEMCIRDSFGTAHVYRSSLNAIIAYRGKKDFVFSEVTSEWLKGFEVYLRSREMCIRDRCSRRYAVRPWLFVCLLRDKYGKDGM